MELEIGRKKRTEKGILSSDRIQRMFHCSERRRDTREIDRGRRQISKVIWFWDGVEKVREASITEGIRRMGGRRQPRGNWIFSCFWTPTNSLGVCLRGELEEPSIDLSSFSPSLSLFISKTRNLHVLPVATMQTGPCVQPAGKHGCH